MTPVQATAGIGTRCLPAWSRALARMTVIATVCLSLGLASAPLARADSQIVSFSSASSTTQAGGHPNIVVSYKFGNRFTQTPPECDCNDPQNILTGLPTGVIGNPLATPQCSRVDFGADLCSPSTQVGVVKVNVYGSKSSAGTPLYNLEPGAGQAGLFGFYAPLVNSPIFTVVSARTGGDYGLDLSTEGIEHIIPPEAISYELWGVPAAHSNDADRAPVGGGNCGFGPYPCGFRPNLSDAEQIPFLDNPTTCGVPLESTLEIQSYDGGVTTATTPYSSTTGCDQLSFNPSLYAQPTTGQADSPSGLDVDLSVPQTVSPTTPSPSEIHGLRVSLPAGMSINPDAADGKTVCTDAEAQIGAFGSEGESQCPEDSEVGTVTLASSSLPGPINGFAYLGESKPGERYRLIITANGYATHVKLAGTVEPDPTNGRPVVSFANLPQSPITEVDLHLFGGERGLLATPTQCGTYPVESAFTPWDTALAEQTSTQYFTIGTGANGGACPGSVRPFTPGFTAGVTESTAGVHAPLSLELSRNDGDQYLASFSVTTPDGLLATLAGIPYCSDAALVTAAAPGFAGLTEEASPSCPAASQVGVSQAGAGAGPHPVFLPGKVYLAGPYKGAPLSLAVITPAVSGPYDLGDVVVRAALNVDPESAQVTAVSDPLPQILEGIPLRLRRILIDLNRPGFTINPTDCGAQAVQAVVAGAEGGSADLSSPFQVANCAVLPFKPSLSIRLSGSPKRSKSPALTATVTATEGEANIRRAQVGLPHVEFLDNSHIHGTCSRPQLAAGQCPGNSVYGHARAVSPLLAQPLEGSVYLVTGYGTKLPEIVADLRGQIHILLRGKVDTDKESGIRTTFETVPDAPISKFTFKLFGGKRSLLQNSEPLCSKTFRANAVFTGHNGAVEHLRPQLAGICGKGKKKQRKPPGKGGRSRASHAANQPARKGAR